MMDCVFQALEDHLYYAEGIKADDIDYAAFRAIKHIAQGRKRQPTWGGIIPFICRFTAFRYGLDIRIQHRIFTKAHYMKDAQNTIQGYIVSLTDFGDYEDPLTLRPAVYLLDGIRHATYLERPLNSGVPLMAIQLYRKDEK